MSLVYLGVGQCGTKLTASFLEGNLRKYKSSSILLDGLQQFRGVLVDSEPKSINQIQRSEEMRNHIRKNNMLCGHSGCGSNWAHGYFEHTGHQGFLTEVLDTIRRESEKLDSCLGLCLVHSLAGGTGSGLGLRLVEDACNDLALRLRLTFSVVPHRSGDSPLQAYNSLLCLARLTQLSDSIMLLYNDWLMAQLQLWQSSSSPTVSQNQSSVCSEMPVSIDQMNQLASDQMNNILAPCRSTQDCTSSTGEDVFDANEDQIHRQPLELSHSLTALPEARLLRCVSTPTERSKIHKDISGRLNQEYSNWDYKLDLLQHALRQCPIDATWNFAKPGRQTGCRPMHCLAALLTYRVHSASSLSGEEFASPSKRLLSSDTSNMRPLSINHPAIRRLRYYLRPAKWNDEPIDQWFDIDSRTTRNSVTLAFNSCCIVEDLNCLIARAHARWKVGAYLHWYKMFGCSEDMFSAAFEQMKYVVDGYEHLAG